jgi:beta-glucanase (GH16 family)
MKKLFILLCVLGTFISNSQILWQINKDTVITYHYFDGDEFSENEVSKEKWSSWYGWARSIVSNKEQQYYSDYKNHELKNGCLYLTTRKENVEARFVDWMGDNDSIKSGKGEFQGLNKRSWKYTGGLIHSKKSFLKGYFEIKFKAPSDKGLWPAFWLYGGSPNEEIDIMELKGERENQIHVETHCQKCDMVRNPIGLKRSFGGWIKLDGKLNEGFNIVSGLWLDNEVRYYLNGKCIAVSKVKFEKPKALAANVAVADDNGPFHPGPDKNDTEFEPLIIDYIRVWTKDEEAASPITLKVDDLNPQPDNTKAKHSPKMLYGTKKDHASNGIFVSLIKLEDGNAKLFCNGMNKNESYKLKVSNGNQILLEQNITEREFIIPYPMSHDTKVEVTYGNKTASKTFLLTR